MSLLDFSHKWYKFAQNWSQRSAEDLKEISGQEAHNTRNEEKRKVVQKNDLKEMVLRVKHEKTIVAKISLMDGRWIDTVAKGVDDSLCQSMVSY